MKDIAHARQVHARALDRGILLTDPDQTATASGQDAGLRVCLGAPSRARLEDALRILRDTIASLRCAADG